MSVISYLEGRWSHWLSGAKSALVNVGSFLAPLGDEIAHLTEDQATSLVQTAGSALQAGIIDAQAKVAAGGSIHALDILHSAGHAVANELPMVGITLSSEAIQGIVATAAAARKQANQTTLEQELAKPPANLAPAAQGGDASTGAPAAAPAIGAPETAAAAPETPPAT